MHNSGDIEGKSLFDLSPEEKGRFLASIGTRSKRRAYGPVTVARILSNTPCRSHGELAKNLPVTARTVGMFKSLLLLPQDIQHNVMWTGGISFDKAVRIASLREDLLSQRFLAKAILDSPRIFTAPVVTKIISLKSNNKNMTIEECINKVLKSRPIIDNCYVLVTSIRKRLSEILHIKADQIGVSSSDILKNILEQSGVRKENLMSIVTHENVILLLLKEDAWSALRQKAGSLGVPIDEIVETIVKSWLEVDSYK